MTTNILNNDTVDHFASQAFHVGWDQMLIEARKFVEVDCDWDDEDDMEDVFEDLIDQVKRFINL